jgi:hypothetical protein
MVGSGSLYNINNDGESYIIKALYEVFVSLFSPDFSRFIYILNFGFLIQMLGCNLYSSINFSDS